MAGRRNRAARTLAMLTVALALVAAACGSSSKSTAGGTSGTTAPPPTGAPIKIGWVGTVTTATGVTPNEGKDTMDTWLKWTNSHGGLSGHPVQIVYADDKADPAVGLAAVKDLVENQHVVALVGNASGSTQQTWAPYVVTKQIPVIGSQLIDALWFTNPMFYPNGGSVVANIWGQMKSAAVNGNKKVAVVLCTESPACAQAQPLFTKNATDVGMQMVYNTLASRTQVSYTAECLAAKNAGATALANFTNVQVMANDCARQGYNPDWISAGGGPGLQLIKQIPALGKTVGSGENWICGDKTIQLQAAKDLRAAQQQYHPEWMPGGKYADQAGAGCGSWSAGVEFAKAVSNAAVPASAAVANTDVIRGLSMFKGETLGGIVPPLTFSDGTKPNPQVTCAFLYKWDGQTLIAVKAPDGNLWTCM
jgi:branched-chain amino acid transport system substrate-binding protein